MSENWLLLDDALVRSNTVPVTPGAGVWRGRGWFETFAVLDRELFHPAPHLRRLRSSLPERAAQTMESGALIERLRELARRGPEGPASLRLNVWKQSDGYRRAAWVRSYDPPTPRQYRRGIGLEVCRRVEPPRGAFSHQKRFSYDEVMTRREQTDRWGVLYCNEEGEVWETGLANLLWMDRGAVCTTPPDEAVLTGTVQEAVLEEARNQGREVRYERRLHREIPSPCWVSNALIGMLPVRQLGERSIDSAAEHDDWVELRENLLSAKVFPPWHK